MRLKVTGIVACLTFGVCAMACCQDKDTGIDKAQAFEKSKSWVEAAEAYEKAGNKVKAAKCLWNEYAKARVVKGNKESMDRAGDLLDTIAKKYPETFEGRVALFHKAYRYKDFGDDDKALATFKDYVAKNPEGERVVDAYLEIGAAYEAQKDVQQAIEAFEKAVESARKQGFYSLILAAKLERLYVNNQDYQNVILMLEGAIKAIGDKDCVLGGLDSRPIKKAAQKEAVVSALKSKIQKYKDKESKPKE